MATPYNPDIHGDINAVIKKPEFKAGPAVTEPAGDGGFQSKAPKYDPKVHGVIEQPQEETVDNPFEQVRDLAQLIADKESRGNYNLAYDGTATGMEGDFTTKTIDEILDWQDKHVANGSKSSAIGRYQIIRKTMRDLKQRMGLKGDEKFDEAMQDRMFVELTRKRGLDKWQAGELSDEDFANNLAKEWASLPVIGGDRNGQSYYAGDGLNKAHYSPEIVLGALGKERLPAELAQQPKQKVAPEQGLQLEPLGDGIFKDDDGRLVRMEKGRAYDARTGEALFAGALSEDNDVGRILADQNVTRDQAFATIGEVLGLSKQAQQKLSDLFGFAPEAIKEVTGANLYENTSEAVARDDMIGAAMEVGLEILPPGLEEAARSIFVGAKSARAGTAFTDRSSGKSVYERFTEAEQAPDFDPEAFRKEHGWFRDDDGSLQFEIDDSKAKWTGDSLQKKFVDGEKLLRRGVNGLYENAQYRLGDILQHDELFMEYPELVNLRVGFFPNTGRYAQVGGFASQDGKLLAISQRSLDNPEELRKVILHEVEHIIQAKEGWTGGNSVNGIRDKMINSGEYDTGQNLKGETIVNDAFDNHLPSNTLAVKYESPIWNMVLQGRLMGEKKGKAFIRKEIVERGIPLPRGMKIEDLWTSDDLTSAAGMVNSNAKRIQASLKTDEKLAAFLKERMEGLSILRKTELEVESRYYSTLGEANSRNVEARADFSEETRKNVSPFSTRDVKREQLMDRDGNRLWKLQDTTPKSGGKSDSAVSESSVSDRAPAFKDSFAVGPVMDDKYFKVVDRGADFDEVMDNLDNFEPDMKRIVKALDKADWMGYDTPAEALRAILRGEVEDMPSGLKSALGRMVNTGGS